MIVIFKNNANPEQVKQLCAGFEAQGLPRYLLSPVSL